MSGVESFVGGAVGAMTSNTTTVPQLGGRNRGVRRTVQPLACPTTWTLVARKGKKLSRHARLLKYLSSNIGYRIYRYQNVADWGTPAASGTPAPLRALVLGLNNAGLSSLAAATLNLPMYAFNLGTMPWGKVSGITTGSVPKKQVVCYRLRKRLDGSGWFYDWQQVDGLHNDNTGTSTSKTWDQEYVHGKGTRAPFDCVDNAYHAWDDIKLLIQGAIGVPSWVNVAIGRFTDYSLGPVRDADVDIDTRNNKSEQAAKITAFWDHFWARKCRNPIISSGYHHVKKILKFSFHKVIEACPTMTVNSDSRPKVSMLDIKHDVNRVEDLTWQNAQIRNSGQVLANAQTSTTNPDYPRFGYNTMYANGDGTNQFGVYPDYKKNDWLFVWANNPNQVLANEAQTSTGAPSFDIVIRSKWETGQFATDLSATAVAS